MPVNRLFVSLATVFSLAIVSFAQSCNPISSPPGSCTPNPGLPSSTYSIDFTQQTAVPKEWTLSNWANLGFGTKGAEFTVGQRFEAPQLWTNFYVFFGKIETVAQVAPGTGIISSAVLMSDDADEIDWEFSGNNFGNTGSNGLGQNNYYGKGITGWYDRGQMFDVATPQTQFHTYTVDWKPDKTTWAVDGVVIRTLYASDADADTHQYPQTPSKFQLGIWSGGDPGNAWGTVSWAGGYTDFSKAPFTMYVKSVKITNYNPAYAYNWTDQSGSANSIQLIQQPLNASSSSTTSSSASSTKSSSVPSSTISVTTEPSSTVLSTSSEASTTSTAALTEVADPSEDAGQEDGAEPTDGTDPTDDTEPTNDAEQTDVAPTASAADTEFATSVAHSGPTSSGTVTAPDSNQSIISSTSTDDTLSTESATGTEEDAEAETDDINNPDPEEASGSPSATVALITTAEPSTTGAPGVTTTQDLASNSTSSLPTVSTTVTTDSSAPSTDDAEADLNDGSLPDNDGSTIDINDNSSLNTAETSTIRSGTSTVEVTSSTNVLTTTTISPTSTVTTDKVDVTTISTETMFTRSPTSIPTTTILPTSSTTSSTISPSTPTSPSCPTFHLQNITSLNTYTLGCALDTTGGGILGGQAPHNFTDCLPICDHTPLCVAFVYVGGKNGVGAGNCYVKTGYKLGSLRFENGGDGFVAGVRVVDGMDKAATAHSITTSTSLASKGTTVARVGSSTSTTAEQIPTPPPQPVYARYWPKGGRWQWNGHGGWDWIWN